MTVVVCISNAHHPPEDPKDPAAVFFFEAVVALQPLDQGCALLRPFEMVKCGNCPEDAPASCLRVSGQRPEVVPHTHMQPSWAGRQYSQSRSRTQSEAAISCVARYGQQAGLCKAAHPNSMVCQIARHLQTQS